jgi:acyl carrier protein
MDHAAVLAALTEIFREVFDDDDLSITEATTADDIDGWDSMNHITLVVETERRFKVKFQTAEIEELKNVGEFVSLIAKKQG